MFGEFKSFDNHQISLSLALSLAMFLIWKLCVRCERCACAILWNVTIHPPPLPFPLARTLSLYLSYPLYAALCNNRLNTVMLMSGDQFNVNHRHLRQRWRSMKNWFRNSSTGPFEWVFATAYLAGRQFLFPRFYWNHSHLDSINEWKKNVISFRFLGTVKVFTHHLWWMR